MVKDVKDYQNLIVQLKTGLKTISGETAYAKRADIRVHADNLLEAIKTFEADNARAELGAEPPAAAPAKK